MYIMDITTIGELLIDLTQIGMTQSRVPTFAANPGGAPANVAVSASRLGASTAFLGKVGTDGFGSYLVRVLGENGVDVSGMRTGSSPTTMAIVSVDSTGERDFQFIRGADCQLEAKEVNLALISQSQFLHFGSVTLTADPARHATLFAVQKARELGVLVSYDPNYRDALWESEEEAIKWMKMPLPMVDVLKVSQEELLLIADTNDLNLGTKRLADYGITLVLVTLGADGAFYRIGDVTGYVAGKKVSVVDTNGAGDTFLGAVLTQLCCRGKMPLEGLTPAEIENILSFANLAAAWTCSHSGAIPAMPSLAELTE